MPAQPRPARSAVKPLQCFRASARAQDDASFPAKLVAQRKRLRCSRGQQPVESAVSGSSGCPEGCAEVLGKRHERRRCGGKSLKCPPLGNGQRPRLVGCGAVDVPQLGQQILYDARLEAHGDHAPAGSKPASSASMPLAGRWTASVPSAPSQRRRFVRHADPTERH